ncbi:hypothetical protein NUG13_12125 [Bacillus subtilis]|uniref:Uncharacterized protein n=1 Tax=Bacillus phage vB_BsuS_PJN02 TaxID=2920374 RepID=A0AC61TSD9_9CAUD|nr:MULTISPECIES: hypothetical protein [Bacillus subtilis group]YP_010681772.1 hypothetical protein PQE76_gp154 [Bacillus phage vB_BsuS_PJN02]MCR4362076.1 hypothetical protein [Bacillus subtilis]UNH58497.1 hypothetical protein [Bacillus phage vB_BsuS_PJN02]UQB84311.1 hypothetical protein KMZ31_19510 [Bacillus amyloliquefaciens]WOF32944.1 hypothetical protein OEJ84_22735 [Bacillus subtilis]
MNYKDIIKSYLVDLFPNYKTIQVEPFLDKVTMTKEYKNLVNYKTFLGIKYAKSYSKTKENRIIYFTKDGNLHDLRTHQRIYFVFGVDPENRVIYWKYDI